MTCAICGSPIESELCPKCGQAISEAEVTGTLSADALTLEADPESISEALPLGHAALRVVRGPLAGEVWTLDGAEISVGRAPESKLFLDDITVSRNHAIFKQIDGSWSLHDLGSLNGTYVNREILADSIELNSGDEIQIGKFRFTFYRGENQ